MQRYKIAKDVSFDCCEDQLAITGPFGTRRLSIGSELAQRLALLNEQPQTMDDLTAGLIGGPRGMVALATLTKTIQSLARAGWLDILLEIDSEIIAQLITRGRLQWREGAVPHEAIASPYIVAIQEGGWVRLESASACGIVRVKPSIAGSVIVGEDLMPGERLAPLRDLLWRAGLMVLAKDKDTIESTMWNPVDLLMIERSNDSAANEVYGASYRYADDYPCPPLVEQIDFECAVPLPSAESERWASEDPPFGMIAEQRRSVSAFDPERSPTLKQLTNILHRCARFQQVFRDDKGVELGRRPVASGGAIHELDLYVAVDRVVGLESGLWRYNPISNCLERIKCGADPRGLMDSAAVALPGGSRPPITVILVAKFARVLWKYEGVGAALILKNAGVLLHALQLSAVAEGLGACPLGSNSAGLFMEVTGLGFPGYGPVAQLVIGVPEKENLP